MPPAVVTLLDVAEAVGVHPSTVSRALDPTKAEMVRESTRHQIADAALRLGYRPHMGARSLQSGRTATIGIVTADLGNTFVTPIIHGVAASIEGSGFLPMIAETQDDTDRFSRIIDHMLSRRVDAMVVVAARDGDRAMLESAARLVPIVIAARPLEGSRLPHVIHDDECGGEVAARHLADLGHMGVTQIHGPIDVANFRRRATGFSGALSASQMREIPAPRGALHADAPTIEEGERLMAAVLESRERPSAVFAHNDLMALGAMSAIEAAGLHVPHDISMIGYNDLPTVGHLRPALTTVRYPSLEVGQHAGRIALELLGGERPGDVKLAPQLMIRDSTAGV